MAYTEFCCRSGGSNMNGGALSTNAEPPTTAAYSATNGGWNSATGVFTPASGNPSSSGVTVGDFASVFVDGATTPVFIGRVTAVNATTVTVSTTAKSGTAPTTAGSGISINVGGAWAGPSGTVGFPFNFVTTSQTNSNIDRPRVNFKNDQTANMTATIAMAQAGTVKWQGYTTTFGDGGRATIDGGTSGASYSILQLQNQFGHLFEDLIFKNNGATGASSLVAANTGGSASAIWRRCTFANSRGMGLDLSSSGGSNNYVIECEAYDCNQSNTAGFGGFGGSTSGFYLRCYSHGHTGSNSAGFNHTAGGNMTAIDCIADSCAGAGFLFANNLNVHRFINCDAYNCGSDGFKDSTAGGTVMIYIENCNAIKNGGWGINFVSGEVIIGSIVNCRFGAGTQANTSGTINVTSGTDSIDQIGNSSYASNVTPWNAPTTGDFTLTLAAAKNAGRGNFMQSQNSKTGTLASPDIGAAQHVDSGGGGGYASVIGSG